jgi:acylphosphatase
VSIRILVSGRVQGVSFRATLREKALHNRVDGWVRNTSEGSVEALLQGEEEAVKKVVDWARRGPPSASVSMLTEKRLESHPRHAGFTILS